MTLSVHLRLFIFLSLFTAALLDIHAATNPPPALTNWQLALVTFQKSGALIGEEKLAAAKSELSLATASLPPPYDQLALQFRDKLATLMEATVKGRRTREDWLALADLCASLHAYDAAVRFQSKAGKTADFADDPIYLWRLWESGQLKTALAEYKRRLPDEPVDVWKDHYREQIRLIELRPANLTNAAFGLELVQQHYLKGFEEKPDPFGALQELSRVLHYATDPKDAIAIHQLIIRLLTDLGDDAGRDAWEDQLLAACPTDQEIRGRIYMEQGTRAYRSQNLPLALTYYHQIATGCTNSSVYGDAQYGIGWVLQQQTNLTAAVSEYQKLFSSSVDDYKIDPQESDDYKNYRYRAAIRISECYEALHDLPHALEYAELARDSYKFLSYCKSCLHETQAILTNRIAQLRAAADQKN